MNSRERFKQTMGFDNPDRVPYFEEGIREDVLRAWRKQGMPVGVSFSTLFKTDHQEELAPDLEPMMDPKMWPRETSELMILREALDPTDMRRLPSDWPARTNTWRNRDHVLMIRVHRGIFETLGISNWNRFSEVIVMFKDDPLYIHEVMDIQSEFAVTMLEKILGDVEVDAAIFSEPIGGNSGPLISPQMYKEFALNSYAPILNALRDHGVETIIFRTYANARILLPSVIEAGINCLWASEVETDSMDYRDIRREFGRDLGLIGGIDLDALLGGKEAIREEIEEKTPELLAQGGYIPLADGRVRAGVPYDCYVYYRRLLEKVISGAYRSDKNVERSS
jgi:uroporphyrinogen decarboxylase